MRTRLAGLLALALLAFATPADAAAADSWRVPTRAWLTVSGHGYGHGHGMSQYGAEGAARQGLTYRQIAGFYYPGTAWGSAGGRIRVAISADTSDDLVVLSRPGLMLRDTAGGPAVRLPENGATRWRVTVTPQGRNRVSYKAGRWRRWGDLRGEGEFSAGGRPITLVTPSGNRPYRGRLRAVAPSRASLARDTVNDLALDQYLRGVVPLEIPASWSPEAVRAQAVAARTYATYERAHRSGGLLCDTTSCQAYGGQAAEHPASDAAIRATAGQVLTYDGAPAFTQFASSSGGWTSAGSVPYLAAVEDPYDGWAGNPVHDWTTRLNDTVVERVWPRIGDLTGLTVTRRDGNGEWGGRVRSLTLTGTKGSVVVSGDAFRSALGLRSTWLTFAVSPR
ncbi:SpoIID/LytB domain-containing protein [Nocardioides sp. cx-173]|uniref:SpoIID/LytB domain-containing protein n=1 Tax=Nocardioides sp. cx-173 TaxID=2898796 RepID=UPI001E4B1F35|nr:SpoIID/LytB domain-containing protein [Nocardioides sp. cx-173]MCD4526983.1 SpoIID/LytB domain-containing protein [Nocardioides sp. cx-173]UGB41082.1 SpoIID/LytB domain-containing protein [Nocardioides sp. cx-173]